METLKKFAIPDEQEATEFRDYLQSEGIYAELQLEGGFPYTYGGSVLADTTVSNLRAMYDHFRENEQQP